ncbi:TolC family outer membrane protein [Variovorax dokdonensis]|uniref:TolC family outer membrane protein n=1 Tax=Variovorax dokdonensis TaxID=344883 RepID=A0ABT7N7H4_9BURK|nr:TolC family outer membrane protein [Variovorax dokdonensis]MDM0043878.1 TolC family outer membrane protein [Variovorax dokdonensis]
MPRLRLVSLCCALIAPLCAAMPAQAQSLIELYEAARGFDATYQSARSAYDAGVARAEQARAGLLPQVGLSASASHTDQELRTDIGPVQGRIDRSIPQESVGINATQPLYRPANWATWEQSRRQLDISKAQLDLAEQDLIVRVSQAYFDVLAAQDALALVRAQKAATAEQLAFAKRNFEVGTATITDTREAQARYDLVLAQEIAAQNDLQIRKVALDQLVGRVNATPTPLAAPVQLPALAPANLDIWVQQAQDGHPSILTAERNMEVAKLEVDKARAGHKPTLDAQLGYNVTNNPNGTSTSTTPAGVRVNAASIGLVFNMPLFAGFATENRIKETLALEDQARSQLDFARRNVAQSTRTAYLGLVSGMGQVKALEAAEASSQSALEANRLGYQVGVRINIDVLNAQSQLFQTRRDLAQARYNVLLGNLRLRQATGSLTPQDLQPLNSVLASAGNSGSAASADQPSAATVSPIAPPPVQGVTPPASGATPPVRPATPTR